MPRRYSEDFRTLVLNQLIESGGNIGLVHRETGVPERTLRYWWRQQHESPLPPPMNRQRQWQQRESVLPPKEALNAGFAAITNNEPLSDEAYEAALGALRAHVIADIQRLAQSLTQDMEHATFHQRVSAYIRLIDHLPKLESLLPPVEGEGLHLYYHNVATGEVSKTPPQGQDDDGDEDPYEELYTMKYGRPSSGQ